MALSQVHYDRPPEGLARGRWAAPRWAIGALGAAIFVLTVAYLVVRRSRTRRGKT